ncbi:MAG: XRE family transcriptional regulator [Flavobacteriales bacterium]|nr:MAG: XRE family transcriptional regulator [Flavobacteriales bacterium]
MSYKKQLPGKIRKIREIKGFSQDYMAMQMEMSQRQYQRLESGKADINMSKLEEICKTLEVSIDQLLGFDEKYIFQNCNNAFGRENEYHNHFPQQLEELYRERIKHLEEEIVYLRNMLKGKL